MATASFGGRVHAAVRAGKSADDVRRAIDECVPPGDERRRAEAVNEMGAPHIDGWYKYETPLQVAHRLRRGDLVGLLLEEGADGRQVLGYEDRPTSALALCVCYDLPQTLRALLRKGHDANQRLTYGPFSLPSTSDVGCTLAHLCCLPAAISADPAPPPRLACLEALVREGDASIDARDRGGYTCLHYATSRIPDPARAAATIELLARLDADINARDAEGRTPIFACAEQGDIDALRRLLAHGASPDVVDAEGYTPLMSACSCSLYAELGDATLELARRSSPETRRAVVARPDHPHAGFSAVDFLVQAHDRTRMPWQKERIAELLASGVPVLPQHAAQMLPVAVSHGLPLAGQKEAELGVRRAELCTSWRAHEAFVGLALDMKELREAQEVLEARRAQVAALEAELRELGAGGTTTSSGSGSSSEDDDDESDISESGEVGSGSSDGEEESESSGGEEEEEEEGRTGVASEGGSDDEDDDDESSESEGDDEEEGDGEEAAAAAETP